MEISTLGTSGISAERFFGLLKEFGITSIIDTRLHPSSQLAGFTKRESLGYFAKALLEIPYIHEPLLCPEDQALKSYRSDNLEWREYEVAYVDLLKERKAGDTIDRSDWGAKPLLLCSEKTPQNCHRRLAADYLKKSWSDVLDIRHL